MALTKPFEWLSSALQKRAFIVIFALSVAIMYAWSVLNRPLMTEAAPNGILSFEVAGNMSKAKSIVLSWGHEGQLYAAVNLGFDYLFLAAYGSAIALGCVLVLGVFSKWRWLTTLGLLLAWAQLVAALLDSVENFALIRILLGADESWAPVLARWCSMPKAVLYGAGMVYALIGAALFAVRKIFRKR